MPSYLIPVSLSIAVALVVCAVIFVLVTWWLQRRHRRRYPTDPTVNNSATQRVHHGASAAQDGYTPGENEPHGQSDPPKLFDKMMELEANN